MPTEDPEVLAKRKAFLKGLPIFNRLDDEELAGLTEISEQASYSAGTRIARQGNKADKLYIVQRGHLEVVNESAANGVVIQDVSYQTGQFFEDKWLFQPSIHSLTIRAQTNVSLILIESHKFLTFRKEKDIPIEKFNLTEAALTKIPLTFAGKRNFLKQLSIFGRIVSANDGFSNSLRQALGIMSRQELEEEALSALTAICEQFSFSKGAIIIHQRDVANRLYIVQSGRLAAARVDENGVSIRGRLYLPGDYFEDIWLFEPGTHENSLHALTDGRLLTIANDKFLEFLKKHDGVLQKINFNLSDEAKEAIAKSPLTKSDNRYRRLKLVPGELVELEKRRSWWVLVGKLAFPLLGFLSLPLLAYLFLLPLITNLILFLVIAFLPVLVFGFLIFFQWIDWANDYLIITNKRLIRYEYDLTKFSGIGKDNPLEQVQSVETERNFINRIFGLGAVRITTAAQSSILYFDYIRSPKEVEQTIDAIRERARALNEGQYQEVMRQSVEKYFKMPSPLTKLSEEKKQAPSPPAIVIVLRFITRVISRIIRPYTYRIEDKTNNTITYRKHLFSLYLELLWPTAIGLILIISLFLLRIFATGNPEINYSFYTTLILVAGLIDFAWIVWRIEDWRNDTFQLTERYVLDIDRLPLGFSESRKKAQLDDVQAVEAFRPNLLATIFNFGYVDIETAGAQSNIRFENVSDPERIKNDIFKQRDKFKAKQRKDMAERTRQQNAVLLDVYVQERELDRIRRRTPNFQSFEEDP